MEQARRLQRAVLTAADRLMSATSWEEAVPAVLEELGSALGACRLLLVDRTDKRSRVKHAWVSPGLRPDAAATVVTAAPVEGLTELAVHRCEPSELDAAEIEALETVARLLGAAIARDRANRAAVRQELLERERAEVQLREAEVRYRTLVEHIPAATYIAAFGVVGTWYYVSPYIERILGFTQAEWMARDDMWFRQLHPDDRDSAMASEEHSRATGEPLVSEYRMFARDGRIVWIRDEGVVVPGPTGDPVLQGVMFDVTDSKRAEAELARALRREQEASERLRVLDEMKNTFLHAVSHELRTPLSSVLGFALTLERDDVQVSPEERQEIMGRIAANARKLDRLLSDLLDIDRLDRGIIEPSRRPTDVLALAHRTVESLSGDRGIRVEGDRVVLAVDGPKVERIIENLLANAARHTPMDATIWVRIERHDTGVLISVEDEGPGVPESDRDVIFEPFSQGPAAPAHAPGVGIGLSLVSRFAELHGGRACVEDRPGGGASFRVFLP